MKYSTYTWDLVWALESASPQVYRSSFLIYKYLNLLLGTLVKVLMTSFATSAFKAMKSFSAAK